MKYTVDYSSLEQIEIEADNATAALIAAQAKDADDFVTVSNDWSVFETESGRCVDSEIDFDAVDDDGPSGDDVQPSTSQTQTNEYGEPLCRCDKCQWLGTADEIGLGLWEITDLAEQLEPGAEVPVGKCAQCSGYAYFVKTPPQVYSLAEIRNGTGFPSSVRFIVEPN